MAVAAPPPPRPLTPNDVQPDDGVIKEARRRHYLRRVQAACLMIIAGSGVAAFGAAQRWRFGPQNQQSITPFAGAIVGRAWLVVQGPSTSIDLLLLDALRAEGTAVGPTGQR
jgi:hypothetical protein